MMNNTWTISEPYFADVVEVLEVGQFLANHYLRNGYKLLGTPHRAEAELHGGGQWYVRRRPRFVVGRPEGVDSVEPPPRQAPQS
jgi:hypothetical protein